VRSDHKQGLPIKKAFMVASHGNILSKLQAVLSQRNATQHLNPTNNHQTTKFAGGKKSIPSSEKNPGQNDPNLSWSLAPDRGRRGQIP